MKDWLKKQLEKKEARKRELNVRASAATTVEELRGINTELETLNAEITDFRSQLDALPEDAPAGGATPPAEGRSAQVPAPAAGGGGNAGLTQVLSSFGLQQARSNEEPSDKYGTLEYRNAFKAFALTGEVKPELRANAQTTSADVSAIIPTPILNEVIKKMEIRGRVWARVRKLNIKGGVEVPISSVKPVATWITEGTVSDRQKMQLNSKVSFSYFGLECKVAVSLLADTITLEGFESLVVELIVEAMIKALETGVVSGTGSGQMLGITVDARVPVEQKVTLDETEIVAYQPWKQKVFAKMPLGYQANAVFFMASGTFETYIDGMVDNQGQPIGRVNFGIADAVQQRFGGKPVILVEDDLIKPYDTAVDGDVVAIYCDLSNYAVNTNLQMQMFRYLDHDTNQWVDKAILIADGKLLDANGVVLVLKDTSAGT